MNESHERSNFEETLSRFLDGELTPDERERVETILETSPNHRESFLRMKAVSDILRETTELRLSQEEETAFDSALSRRLRNESNPSKGGLPNPFRSLGKLSWQWRTTLALSILLVCYIPVLMQTSHMNDPETVPRINSDYSNSETFFTPNPEAGYDLYGVLPKQDAGEDAEKPEKTPPAGDKNSPIGFYSAYRA